MADPGGSDSLPQWLSITGQPLDLNCSGGFLGSCAAIESFETLNHLGEGSYGVVSRARDRRTSTIVALKQVRIERDERQNGIPITALREISILRSLSHANIVNVLDVAASAGQQGNRDGEPSSDLDQVYMVMEYAEQDMANLLDELHVQFKLSEGRRRILLDATVGETEAKPMTVKCLFRQLLEGLEYLHRNDIIHRDIKMQNLLLTARGILKIADFGMAREYSARPLTAGVVTIWYRAPELLLGARQYTPAVDLWSAGIVLGELLLSEPVLPGEREVDQLALIVKLLGSPSSADLGALSEMGCPELLQWRRTSLPPGRVDNLARKFSTTTTGTVAMLAGLLKWDPRARWTASEALGKKPHAYLADAEAWWRENPKEIDRALLPTFPEVRNRSDAETARARHGVRHRQGDNEAKADSYDMDGYVFDFDGVSQAKRGTKRHKAW